MKLWLTKLFIAVRLMAGKGKGCRNISEYYANLPYIIFKDSE